MTHHKSAILLAVLVLTVTMATEEEKELRIIGNALNAEIRRLHSECPYSAGIRRPLPEEIGRCEPWIADYNRRHDAYNVRAKDWRQRNHKLRERKKALEADQSAQPQFRGVPQGGGQIERQDGRGGREDQGPREREIALSHDFLGFEVTALRVAV